MVSIIITCYNYEKYVGECIQSCIGQSYEDIEIIVVNDASTDNSSRIISNFRDEDRRIVSVSLMENKGYSYAKNTGILISSGNYIALIDADDKLTKDSIKERATYLDAHPKVGMVHGIALRWYGGNDIRGYNKKTYVHAQGRMYRRSVFERYGLYYEKLRSMSDKEMVYRLGVHPDSPLPRKIKDKKLKKVVALYRKHETQMHKMRKIKNPKENKLIKHIFKERIKQIQKEGITRENTKFL